MRNDSMHLFCALRLLLWVALDGTLEGLVKEPTEQFRLFGTSEGRGVEQSGILGATRCFDLVSHFPIRLGCRGEISTGCSLWRGPLQRKWSINLVSKLPDCLLVYSRKIWALKCWVGVSFMLFP